jgi:ribosomal protein L7/L12
MQNKISKQLLKLLIWHAHQDAARALKAKLLETLKGFALSRAEAHQLRAQLAAAGAQIEVR